MTKKTFVKSLTKALLPAVVCLLLLMALSAPALGVDLDRQQMLVNKTYTLSSGYVPSDLVYLNNYMSALSSVTMRKDAAIAMGRMVQAAAAQGVTGMYGQSGYRSYSTQSYLYDRKINYYRGLGYGDQSAYYAGRVVAPPGASEHQTGMALDITTAENGYGLTESFGSTTVGKWLYANSWKYGFILRYPKDKTEITGYIYEPWHFRYVGVPHAEYMYKNGICLEEYYQLLKTQGMIEFTTYNGYTYSIYYSPTNTSSELEGVVTCLSMADTGGGYIITVRPYLYDLQGHWSEDEVRSLVDYGVVKGYSDGTFRPAGYISRAELVAMVGRTWDLLFERKLSGQDVVFADVSPSDYYFNSLMKMYEAGLVAASMVEEDEEGRLYFNGDQQVLRYQAAESLAPLFRALPQVTASEELLDMYNESPELREAVQVLVDYGVVKGDNGFFNPQQHITRAEIAAMLDRVIHYYLDK